ncbi:MAG: EF-hand domain-containing protein [Sphingomonadaceae bacterium]|nr:EF-hand domain-containing protein [Sphingomonadaceae bacterium]
MRSIVLLPLALLAATGATAAKLPSDHAMQRMLFVAPNGKPYRGAPGQPYPSAAWFAEADANHDGKLTRAEYRAAFIAYFDTLDINHDGEIDPNEIEHYENDILPETHMTGGGFAGYAASEAQASAGDDDSSDGPKQPPEQPGGASFFGFFHFAEPIVWMDTNFNRGISRDEFAAGADRSWRMLNPDGKPWLTLSDLPKTQAQR